MAGRSKPTNAWDHRILQIINANPGWRVAHKDKDEIVHHPVVCWALVEERELTPRGQVVQTLTSVEAMIPGEHGNVVLLGEDESPNVVVPPGFKVEVDGEYLYAEIDRKVS